MNYKHGLSHTRLDNIYRTMKARCYKPKCRKYGQYGARGIRICDEWLKDKTAFFKWAEESGYREYLTIDRIDNDGDYSPENCRWADALEQANNKSSNVHIFYKGACYTMAEFCRKFNLNYKLFFVKYRRKGFSLEDAMNACKLQQGV